jgi:glutaredoxin
LSGIVRKSPTKPRIQEILPRMIIEIYSKDDCSLCDEAKHVLEQVRNRVPPFELRMVDITKDPVLFARYQYDIPVVFIDGQKAFKHRLDPSEVERRLQRKRGT